MIKKYKKLCYNKKKLTKNKFNLNAKHAIHPRSFPFL